MSAPHLDRCETQNKPLCHSQTVLIVYGQYQHKPAAGSSAKQFQHLLSAPYPPFKPLASQIRELLFLHRIECLQHFQEITGPDDSMSVNHLLAFGDVRYLCAYHWLENVFPENKKMFFWQSSASINNREIQFVNETIVHLISWLGCC